MNTAFKALDLTSVYSNPVFSSHSQEESHRHLCKELNEHTLRWNSGEVDAALYSVGAKQLKLMILRYGPAVEITPRPFDDFSLVQLPLHGRSIIESDGEQASIGPGEVAIISPQRNIRLSWSENCEQLILRIPHTLAHMAAEYASSASVGLKPMRLPPVSVLNGKQSTLWCRLLQSLVDQVSPEFGEGAVSWHPAWVDYLEKGLVVFLMTQLYGQHVSTNLSSRLTESDDIVNDHGHQSSHAGEDPLNAAKRYVLSRLSAPISLEDLARAAGLSTRSLHTKCKKEFGVGPMTWLRDIRLDVAQQRLRQGGARSNVTNVAMAVGFGHFGRFSAYYEERFGELPRATLAENHRRTT
ncbi:TPA: AraC family transcriptional regulator [Burkholderia cenocepacia]|nr:AraC family transcriptional regulator [Burkholderia cenocepacia]